MGNSPNRLWTGMFECELYKLFKNRWMLLLGVCPALLTTGVFFYLGYRYPDYTAGGTMVYASNPVSLLIFSLFKFYQYALPFLVSLVCAQYFLVEHQAGGGKLWFTVPVRGPYLLLVRYAALLWVIVVSIALAYVVFLTGIKIFESFFPLMALGDYDYRFSFFVYFLKILYLCCLIAVIQFGANIIFNNYYIPPIIAFVLTVESVFFNPDYFSYYYGYGYLYTISRDAVQYETGCSPVEAMKMAIIPLCISCGSFYVFLKRRNHHI